jgi:raffinose/stachyose/melibiose transport system permease protein
MSTLTKFPEDRSVRRDGASGGPRTTTVKTTKRVRSDRTFFWMFLAPAFLLTALFMLWPFGKSLLLLFQRWRGYGESTFVGLQNILRLFEDGDFASVMWQTIVYVGGSTIISTVIGVGLALAFYRRIPFSRTLRFLAFLPVVLPPTFLALAWKFALDPNFGWLTAVLGALNPAWDKAWLSDPSATLWIVVAVGVMQYTGIPMLLMLTAFQDIPPSIQEAATLDGASAWRRFWSVTLPLSRDVLVVVIGLKIIESFKAFDQIWALTEGGPDRASDILSTFVFREAFVFGNLDYANAVALAGSTVIILLSLVYTFFFRPQKMELQ